ncbi:uncharacterized protein LOC123534483 isoform X2 [Mercenaria mercenaria]|nr:uncharacterized protein LOC123534483 isoform X2 [Mercenaria mercenaria]
MCGSKMSRKNFTRVITRFSKLGFAVKMKLTGFKIEGINNSGVIWFFSVQGLFHVAFDLGNMAFQRDCLLELQEVWLKRYDDPLLPADGILRFNKRLKVVPEDCILSDVSCPQNIQQEIEARKPVGRACTSKCIVLSNEKSIHAKVYVDYRGNIVSTESVCNCVSSCECCPEYAMEETVSCENSCAVDETDAAACSDPTANNMECNPSYTDNDRQSYEYLGTRKFREKLIQFIQTTFIEEVSNPVVRQIMLVLEYLNYFAKLEKTDAFENFGCILFKIMEEFLVLVGVDDGMPNVFKNTFGISREKFILLYQISDWLGQEYHKLEELIKEKVETFKRDNITCIDTLPSAETITDTLFPSFMKTFVTNWLGFHNENHILHGKSELNVMSDHCYTQPPKNDIPGNINYQLVQLILEFGSNCLISGIGHVVFSRLQIENRSDV